MARSDQQEQSRLWRIFFAIHLPTRIRSRAAAQSERLRNLVPDASASWTREDNMHLTIKFIGEVSADAVKKLSSAAARAVNRISPFDIVVGGAGAFPKKGPPRIIWIGIDDPSGELHELHKRLDEECSVRGFQKERRAFQPHLTIARLRKPHQARTLASAHEELGFEPADVNVSELLMMRSELSSKGSKYTIVSSHFLKS
jgi:RNA 2',3'-cyclic 3'-phosphodiesterase